MRIFQVIRRSLAIFKVNSPKSSDNFHRFNLINSAILIYMVVSTISTGMFIALEARTFADFSDATFACDSGGYSAILILNLILKTTTVYELFETIEGHIKQRSENPVSKAIYNSANDAVEKWTGKIFHWMVEMTIGTCGPVSLIATILLYLTNRLKRENYVIIFPAWFPFDRRTFPIGYLLSYSFEIAYLFLNSIVAAFFIQLMLGSALMLAAFIEDIKQDLKSLNESLKSDRNPAGFQKRFKTIIQFHSDVKEIASIVSKIYEYILTGYFIWSLFNMIAALALIQTEISSGTLDFGGAFLTCAKSAFSFGLVFLYCEMGERIAAYFATVDATFSEIDWHLFPIATQRMMPVVLMVTQRAVQLHGFGNVSATRGTFKQIANSAFSAFMIFREIY